LIEDQGKYRELRGQAARMAVGWNARNEMKLIEIFRDEIKLKEAQTEETAEKPWDEQRFYRMIASTPETKKFVVISIPRSGSNMLVGMLGGHPEISCFSELFHLKHIFDSGLHRRAGLEMPSVEERNSDPIGFLDYMFRFGNFPRIKSVGFKIFPGHHDQMFNSMIQHDPIKKIVLIRENYLLNYVSLQSASKNNVYFISSGSRAEQEEPRFNIDFEEFTRYEEQQKAFFAQVQELLKQHAQSYYLLFYKDILDKTRQQALLEFLGVNPDPSLLKVRSEKQVKLPLEDKILNFNEIRDKLIASGRGDYLKPEL
jgi:hypothetical protein